MEIQFQSDIGRRRKVNQDYANIFVNQSGVTLALLADGMGGHLAGDVASELVVSNIGLAWESSNVITTEEAGSWLVRQIQKVNLEVYEKGQNQPELQGMGTTIVAAAVFNTTIVLAHVGDSRAYVINQQEMRQITEDHSLVNELVKSGEITKEMAEHHPQKNILIRSVGMPGDVQVDLNEHMWLNGETLLICSDGLTNMVTDEEIQAIICSGISVAEQASSLIEAANEAGGTDNITVVLVHFNEEEVQ
jgi:protein phosphatase